MAGETTNVVGPGCAVMEIVAVAELFAVLGSTADILAIVTGLIREAPFKRSVLVTATMVIVSEAPLAREAKVTVCGFRSGLLLQTPAPLVDVQETNVVPAGRLSETVAELAPGPLLVSVIV